jgi:hypothetical protein
LIFELRCGGRAEVGDGRVVETGLERRVAALIFEKVAEDAIGEQADAAADGGAAVFERIPSETEARFEVGVVVFIELMAGAGADGSESEGRGAAGVLEEVGDGAAALDGDAVVLVTQAVGEREIWKNFPGVLHVAGGFVLDEVEFVVGDAGASAGEELSLRGASDETEDRGDFVFELLRIDAGIERRLIQRRDAVAAEGVESEILARDEVGVVVGVDVAELTAEFDGVIAPDFGEVVGSLIGALAIAAGGRVVGLRATEGCEDGQLVVGAAAFGVDVADGVKFGNAGATEEKIKAIEAEAGFIGESRRKTGGETDGDALRFLSGRSGAEAAGQRVRMERIRIAEIVVDVADEEVVVGVELVVDLDRGVFVLFARLAGEKKRAGGAIAVGNGWIRIEGEDFLHRRVERQAGAVLTFAGNVGEQVDGLARAGLRICVVEDAGLEGGGRNDRRVGEDGDETVEPPYKLRT